MTRGAAYTEEAVEVWKVEDVRHLRKHVQGQLPLAGDLLLQGPAALVRGAAQGRQVMGVQGFHQELSREQERGSTRPSHRHRRHTATQPSMKSSLRWSGHLSRTLPWRNDVMSNREETPGQIQDMLGWLKRAVAGGGWREGGLDMHA